jgi:uncharacterized protein YbjT (DUF2867 family)
VRILVSGASGFAGSLILPLLREEGHELRLYVRNPGKLSDLAGEEVFVGDLLTAQNLRAALDGVEVAYYLVHSMERPQPGSPLDHRPFTERELLAARRFGEAAAQSGVRRIVYLGGLLPATQPSRHLASRYLVEQTLLACVPDSVALRSSIVIGERSRSFRLLVRLIERLPLLPLPAWRDHRTQPIDQRDIASVLLKAKEEEVPGGRAYELGGPETVTYARLLELIEESLLVNRVNLPIQLTANQLVGRIAAAVAGEDPELVVPLMEGLGFDLLAADPPAEIERVFSVRLHRLPAAIEHALRRWEEREPLAAR